MFWHICPLPGILVELPTRGFGDPEAVGYDLYVPTSGFIDPLSRSLIGLGFCAAFTPGFEAHLEDRSGMANKGITYMGGVIESSYRGEWKVILYNTTAEVFNYSAGDRIIQVVFRECVRPTPEFVSVLEETSRGASGFGSSGGF